MVEPAVTRQIFNVFPVILLEINIFSAFIWASPMLYRLKNDEFALSESQVGLIGSMSSFGRIIGPFVTFLWIDRVGRRKLLIFCSTVITLQWILLCIFKNLIAILVSRFVIGIIDAALISLSTVYAAENCYPDVRGHFMSYFSVAHALGCFVGYGLILNLEFRMVHSIYFITSLITTISLFYIVESPEFLIAKSQYHQAEVNFFKLRSKDKKSDVDYFQQILDHNKTSSINEKNGVIAELLESKASRKGLVMASVIQILFYIGTAMGPVYSYTTLLIQEGLSPNTITMLSYAKTFIYMVGSLSASVLLGRFSRKSISMTGFGLTFVVMLTCAGFYAFHRQISPIPYFSYHIFTLLSILELVFSAMLVPWLTCIRGELLPQKTKSLILALSLSLASLVMAVHTKVFWSIAEIAGVASDFLLSAVALLCIVAYNHYCLPETSGKTLIEIEHELGRGRRLRMRDNDSELQTINIRVEEGCE